MSSRESRSVGKLTIGQPQHRDNLFWCDFLFTSKSGTIDDDEIKSVTLEVTRQFKMLLQKNGFWKPGQEFTQPEFKITRPGQGILHLIALVHTPSKRPIILNS